MDWDLLKDMLTSDFWTPGGTSTFFSSPTEAKEYAEQYVILPYDGITGPQKSALLEASAEAESAAWWSVGTSFDSPYDGAFQYWTTMTEKVRKTGDPWLISFFTGQAEISQETIDYVEGGVVRWDLFKESFEDQQKKIPWALIIGALALYMWRK